MENNIDVTTGEKWSRIRNNLRYIRNWGLCELATRKYKIFSSS